MYHKFWIKPNGEFLHIGSIADHLDIFLNGGCVDPDVQALIEEADLPPDVDEYGFYDLAERRGWIDMIREDNTLLSRLPWDSFNEAQRRAIGNAATQHNLKFMFDR